MTRTKFLTTTFIVLAIASYFDKSVDEASVVSSPACTGYSAATFDTNSSTQDTFSRQEQLCTEQQLGGRSLENT